MALAGGAASLRATAPDFSVRGYIEQNIIEGDVFSTQAGVWFENFNAYPYTSIRFEGETWSITLGVFPTVQRAFLAAAYWW